MQTPKYLTEADFSNVSEDAIPFGPLGQIVDVRTYRRYKPENYSRESAVERDIRVINHNLALVADKHSFEELRAEGLLMQQKFAQLRVGSSSRAKWIAGTESVDRHPASIFNCSGMAVNRLGSFADLFELLMLGTGVGFRVFERDIRQLPKLTNKNIQVKFLPYTALPKEQRQEYTSYLIEGDDIHVHIGDSRQGWIDGLMAYLKAVTDPSDTFTQINYTVDSVRPLGERILGFGGTASGPEALQGIIQNVVRIIQECPEEYLRSIDCMDVCCAIARGVVAGSTRRSALICLFDEGDELCANAKKGLYTDPSLFHKQYRSQSNNTECIGSRYYETLVAWLKQNPEATEEQIYAYIEQFKPTRKQFSKRMVSIKSEGEPGIDNFLGMVIRRYLAARKWRPDQDPFLYMDVVTNPCHEIILSIGFKSLVANLGKSGSFCNLTTNNLPQFVKFDEQGNAYVDYEELEVCQRLSTRIGVRQTCVDIPLQGWNETQLEERLLGVSATGWQDMFDMLGWDATSPEASDLRKKMRAWANDEATKYAEKLGIPRPLLVTTVKPEGTTSQVYGVSWGLHNNWSPYYIRRIRITSKDALAQVLLEQGYPCFPEVYDLDKVEDFYEGKDWEKLDAWQKLKFFSTLHPHTKKYILDECNTIVFEFPVKSSAKKTQAQVSAVAQLENTRLFALEYTDHMPSSTISVKEDEWESVIDWLDHNWTHGFVTVSFLSFDDAKYPLLPYESIEEGEYQVRLAAIPSELKQALDCGRAYFKVDMDLLSKKEYAIDNPDDVSMDADCSKGSCPVR